MHTNDQAGEVLSAQAAVTRLVHAVDARRWEDLEKLFCKGLVATDYTSLFGGAPTQQEAPAVIAGWRGALSPVAATQHLLGPIDVSFAGGKARAECQVRAHHYHLSAPGGGEWVVVGRYAFTLERQTLGYRIRSMTITVIHQSGNLRLLAEAAASDDAIAIR